MAVTAQSRRYTGVRAVLVSLVAPHTEPVGTLRPAVCPQWSFGGETAMKSAVSGKRLRRSDGAVSTTVLSQTAIRPGVSELLASEKLDRVEEKVRHLRPGSSGLLWRCVPTRSAGSQTLPTTECMKYAAGGKVSDLTAHLHYASSSWRTCCTRLTEHTSKGATTNRSSRMARSAVDRARSCS